MSNAQPPTGGTTTRPRRPDASMSLLTELVEHPIDPEYAAAAERRKVTGERPKSQATRLVMMALLAAIGLLTVAAVLALRAPSTGDSSAKQALLQRIRSETSAADRLQSANNALRTSNDTAQADLLRLVARGQLADRIQLLGIVSGSLAVQGPGLRVTVDDAPGSAASPDADAHDQAAADQGRVQDRDLQTVVNGLWAAGADLLRLVARGQLADRIQLLGVVSGSLAVQGPGLRVTVDDAPGSAASPDADAHDQAAADQGRVQDRDLQTVVNGLWAAGAEAISINGQRLTALSAIRSAGQAILVDFRPLSPPYVISAVGDPDPMQALFANGSGGRYLHALSENFQIPSEVTQVKSLSLPASSGLTLHEAVPAATSTSSATSSSTSSEKHS